MSAPKDAKRLDAHASAEKKKDYKLERVKCSCSWSGHLGELLCEEQGDDETLWCPQCRTSGWDYE